MLRDGSPGKSPQRIQHARLGAVTDKHAVRSIPWTGLAAAVVTFVVATALSLLTLLVLGVAVFADCDHVAPEWSWSEFANTCHNPTGETVFDGPGWILSGRYRRSDGLAPLRSAGA